MTHFPWKIQLEDRGMHVAVFTPPGITLNQLRRQFGTDPDAGEPCFYNQDWYLKEDFATTTATDGRWHVLAKEVRDDWRAKQPEEIEQLLRKREQFPTAVTAAFTFFAYWFARSGEKLWVHDFLWCRDRDHNGDRIYVGRYEDPTNLNKDGFSIHRHLTLRSAYSAAPEIV